MPKRSDPQPEFNLLRLVVGSEVAGSPASPFRQEATVAKMNNQASGLGKRVMPYRAERAPVVLPASIVTMSAYQFPELADISQSGAKLRGAPLPAKGTSALLRVGPLEVLCRVMWVKGEQCGIRFDEPVSPRLLKQIQLDGAIALETFSTPEDARVV